MQKSIIVGILFLFFIVPPLGAQPQDSSLRNQLLDHLQQTCNTPGFLNCMQIDMGVCIQATERALKNCHALYPYNVQDKASFDRHDLCLKMQLAKALAVSDASLASCEKP